MGGALEKATTKPCGPGCTQSIFGGFTLGGTPPPDSSLLESWTTLDPTGGWNICALSAEGGHRTTVGIWKFGVSLDMGYDITGDWATPEGSNAFIDFSATNCWILEGCAFLRFTIDFDYSLIDFTHTLAEIKACLGGGQRNDGGRYMSGKVMKSEDGELKEASIQGCDNRPYGEATVKFKVDLKVASVSGSAVTTWFMPAEHCDYPDDELGNPRYKNHLQLQMKITVKAGWGPLSKSWTKTGYIIGKSGSPGQIWMDKQKVNKEDTAIRTYTGGAPCKNMDVKLDTYPIGTVLVYIDGTWTPLCGHYWWDEPKGAMTVCQNLGYDSGYVSQKNIWKQVDMFFAGMCLSGEKIGECSQWPKDFKGANGQNQVGGGMCKGAGNNGVKITCTMVEPGALPREPKECIREA